MMGLGFWEIIFVCLVFILLFGAKALPDIVKALAKAYYAFQKELHNNIHKDDSSDLNNH